MYRQSNIEWVKDCVTLRGCDTLQHSSDLHMVKLEVEERSARLIHSSRGVHFAIRVVELEYFPPFDFLLLTEHLEVRIAGKKMLQCIFTKIFAIFGKSHINEPHFTTIRIYLVIAPFNFFLWTNFSISAVRRYCFLSRHKVEAIFNYYFYTAMNLTKQGIKKRMVYN